MAQLLEQRDRAHSDRELRENEAALRARITQLWQTRMLRYPSSPSATRSRTRSYYHATFLRQIPALRRA